MRTSFTTGRYRDNCHTTKRKPGVPEARTSISKQIGQALAHAFARRNIDVTVASRRPPEALAPQARAIGPTVVAKSLHDALEADTIILAAVSYTHLRAHETRHDLVCRL